jgi:hypothetical protein
MRTRIKKLFMTGMVAVLVSTLAGCFYYRRDDRDDYHHRYYHDRYDRW